MPFGAGFDDLGLRVFERGWLSSNNVLFQPRDGGPAALVDSGYASHAEQTVTLMRQALGGGSLGRVVNSHLHSDHCGGNAALSAAFGCEILVPEVSFDGARRWDTSSLSYEDTGQRCDRFPVHGALRVGSELQLGGRAWRVLPAGGHDPDAVMLFEPGSRVLISADALWEERLAIIFPELEGRRGFEGARAALDLIEALEPTVVIPGHGRPFTDVRSALGASRDRLARFEADPSRHVMYGARSLTMFHMLEHRCCRESQLVAWLLATPIFGRLHTRLCSSGESPEAFARSLVEKLVHGGLLLIRGEDVIVA